MRNLFVRAVTSHRNARLKSAAQSRRIVRSQLFLKRAIILLSIGPGRTAFTRMFDGPSSNAAVFTEP